METEKSVMIYDGDKLVMELVVIIRKSLPSLFSIKHNGVRGGYVLRIIPCDTFKAIIKWAEDKGYDVFDYTEF